MASHDYVLDNAAGGVFRADLNNALLAIVSNNAGTSAPSTTYAHMWWTDTTTNKLKRRNAANSAWIEVLPDITATYGGLLPEALLTTRGDLIRRGASAAERYAIGTAGKVLRSDGTDPGWDDIINLQSEQATTSGTSKDVTGVPAWAKRITVHFKSVSTNGASPICVQLGDSGGIETSGYTATGFGVTTAPGVFAVPQTAGFPIHHAAAAAASYIGVMTLTLEDASTNTWMCTYTGKSSGDALNMATGVKALSDVLTQLRVTTIGGTDTFDSGAISVSWK